MNKIVVLLSGGIDSTTCLAVAIDRCGAESVTALNMYYGQKHKKEIKSARSVAKHYGVDYYEVNMANVMTSSDCSLLKHSSKMIKHGAYSEQIKEAEGKPVETYVPFRNGLFLSVAAAVAVSIGADVIMYGAHADDAAGSAYPDCSVDFVKSMNEAIKKGTGGQVALEAPFAEKTKSEVVAEGIRLGAPYELTWSCYEGKRKPCGKCGTCIDRAKAFAANNKKDPAL